VRALACHVWGQRMSGNNPTPYGYKGQCGYYTDVETGILLLTHRYLDPATGRFLTRDPIGMEGGINLYAYVGNSVITEADPTGQLRIPPWMRVGCKIVGTAAVCVEAAHIGYCIGKGYAIGQEVLDKYKNDKLAHCVAMCEVRRCAHVVASWIAGICKEAWDQVWLWDDDKWGPDDLQANHAGEQCAKQKGECLECCLKKYPPKVIAK